MQQRSWSPLVEQYFHGEREVEKYKETRGWEIVREKMPGQRASKHSGCSAELQSGHLPCRVQVKSKNMRYRENRAPWLDLTCHVDRVRVPLADLKALGHFQAVYFMA